MIKLIYLYFLVVLFAICSCNYIDIGFENYSDNSDNFYSNNKNYSTYLKAKSRYQSFIERNEIIMDEEDNNKSKNEILRHIDLLLLLDEDSNNEYNDLSIISAYEFSDSFN